MVKIWNGFILNVWNPMVEFLNATFGSMALEIFAAIAIAAVVIFLIIIIAPIVASKKKKKKKAEQAAAQEMVYAVPIYEEQHPVYAEPIYE
jgi:uncharacterized membrane protein